MRRRQRAFGVVCYYIIKKPRSALPHTARRHSVEGRGNHPVVGTLSQSSFRESRSLERFSWTICLGRNVVFNVPVLPRNPSGPRSTALSWGLSAAVCAYRAHPSPPTSSVRIYKYHQSHAVLVRIHFDVRPLTRDLRKSLLADRQHAHIPLFPILANADSLRRHVL